MTSQPCLRPGSRGPGQQGVTLLVAVLITGAVLFIIVGVTASLATGARRVNADERQAYTALNATESGLNTLPIRFWVAMTNTPLVLTATSKVGREQQVKDWLANQAALHTYQGTGGTATLTFSNIEAPSPEAVTFDVESSGSNAESAAAKKIVQHFKLQLVETGGGLYAPAAVTSIPDIDASRGNGSVSGTASSGVIGKTVAEALPLGTDPRSFNMTVDSAFGLRQSDYLLLDGLRYRINTVSGNSLNVTLVPAAATPPTRIETDRPVSLIMNAARENKTTLFTELSVSNSSDFHAGETVFIAGQKARIREIRPGGIVALEWDMTAIKPTLVNEGDPVVRDVVALRSAGGIDVSKYDHFGMTSVAGGGQVDDCTVSGCRGEDDPFLNTLTQDGDFTKMLFGLSDAQLNALVPLTTLPDAKHYTMQNAVLHVTAAQADQLFTGNRHHSGLLIIDGDINSPINANVTFDGFIYFRGNVRGKINGSLTVNGAIAISGGKIEGLTEDYTTNLTGTAEVVFNPAMIRRALLALDPTGGRGAKGLTWR